MKDILFNNDARKRIAQGADKLAKAVVATLGPRSRNVAINSFPSPIVVHDGVTVARNVKLKDHFEDLGATLLREASTKTNDFVGDGTTTSTLIANTLIQEGLKKMDSSELLVSSNSFNVMKLREDLIRISKEISEKLEKKSKKLKTKKDKERVAFISAGDSEIAKMVVNAIEASGDNGMVMIEESGHAEDSLESQEGYEFDNGWLDSRFVSNPHKMVVDYSDCYLLLTDYTIQNPLDLTPIVEKVFEKEGPRKPLIIIANDVIGMAIIGMVTTKLKLGYELAAVIAPEFADRRIQALDDLALLTGGNVISARLGRRLEDTKISDLGRVRRIVIGEHKTMIVPSNVDKEEIDERVANIKEQIRNADNKFFKERLEERLAKLTNGVSIIKVGGRSETETRERKERYIDSVNATKAALESGVVAGGGVVLYEIAQDYKDLYEGIITTALEAPYKMLLSNSGINTSFKPKDNIGIDVKTGEQVDMFESGILDPLKVTKLAVEHAFSVAAMFLTTDVVITDEPDNVQKMRIVQ